MAPEIWDRGWKCSHKCSQSFSPFRFSKYPKLNIFYKTFYFGMSKLVLLRFSEWGWSLIEMFTQHTWRNILPTTFIKKICIDLLRPQLNPGLKWLPDPFISCCEEYNHTMYTGGAIIVHYSSFPVEQTCEGGIWHSLGTLRLCNLTPVYTCLREG